VTSREEQNALIDLQKLLASDLSRADQETLIDGVRSAELAFDKAQEWSGRLVAALKQHHGLSWPALERLTDVPKGTLIRRAQPFLAESPSPTADGTG
jgi:hypothetical protein